MVGSYLRLGALLCLALAVGCGDDNGDGNGGDGGSAGTGGTAGTGGGGGDGGMGGDGGTGGDGGMGGEGGTGGGGTPVTKAISIGCGNSITSDVSILDWELTVTPDGAVAAGEAFNATLSGEANFSEAFLDTAQAVVIGGLRKAGLVDINATVQTRGDGATGDDVVLSAGADIPYECWFDDDGPGAQTACDPANDLASVPGSRGNDDCTPAISLNPCVRIIDIPTSDDCEAGGECETLGKGMQCENNGFCVTGSLPIPLDPASGSYTAGDGSADALFGWFDTPADDSPAVATPPVDGDGTYNIVKPTYTGVAGPVGLAVYASLNVQVECVMAVDSGGDDGVSVPDDASPSPDSALLAIPVE